MVRKSSSERMMIRLRYGGCKLGRHYPRQTANGGRSKRGRNTARAKTELGMQEEQGMKENQYHCDREEKRQI